MTISGYVFAFYVFLLVCAGVWFYFKMVRSYKKSKDDGNYEKEQRIFKLYQNVEDMMTSFEEYVEESKEQINKAMAEAVSLLDEAKKENQTAKTEIKSAEEAKEKPKKKSDSSDGDKKKVIAKEMIFELMDDGLNEDEIAKELGISRREVSLFKEMKKIEIKN